MVEESCSTWKDALLNKKESTTYTLNSYTTEKKYNKKEEEKKKERDREIKMTVMKSRSMKVKRTTPRPCRFPSPFH